MKKIISLENTPHDFDKVNTITKKDSRGHYDQLRCKKCGIEVRRYGIGSISLTVVKLSKNECIAEIPDQDMYIGKAIQITHCTAMGGAFSNLIPGSKHLIIPAQHSHYNSATGVWVMGKGEPVKVLSNEFIFVKRRTK
jgi:hypothetical protein